MRRMRCSTVLYVFLLQVSVLSHARFFDWYLKVRF